MMLLTAVSAVPFRNYDRAYARTTPVSAPDQIHTNLNLFTNRIPFGPFDWQKPGNQRAQPDHPPYNLALLQVTTAPFYQTDWSRPAALIAGQPQPVLRNPNLFSEVPFAQYDWVKPFDIASAPPGYGPVNINLFTNPIPFSLTDFGKPFAVSLVPPPAAQLNLSLTTVVAAQSPFLLTDWSGAARPQWRLPDPPALNIALLTGTVVTPAPFSQYDWPAARTVAARPGPDVRNFAILVSVAPSAPAQLHNLPFIATVGRFRSF